MLIGSSSSAKLLLLNLLYFYITFGKIGSSLQSEEKFIKAKEVLLTIIRRSMLKSGTGSEDYITHQIVTNSKLLELVIKAAQKIQKQGYYPANLKDKITILYDYNKKAWLITQ